MDELWEAAKICRVANVMRPIWSPDLTKNVTNLAASVRNAWQILRGSGMRISGCFDEICPGTPSLPYQPVGIPEDFCSQGRTTFELWSEQAHRPTRDADFLSNGDNDPSRFESIFKEICALTVDEDGLQFDRRASKRSASKKMLTMKASVSPS